jgi:hypothetical protein
MPWRPIGLTLPTSWFGHLVVCRLRATARFPRSRCLPQTFAPLQSLAQHHPATINNSHDTLPRFLAPSAPPLLRKPPVPGLPRPGPVASSHLPCALTLSSSEGLPGVFQPGTLLGFRPSALLSPEIDQASRPVFPSCDWLGPAPDQQPSEDGRCGHRHFGPVGPPRLHSRGFIPLTPGSAAAGFLRWSRLPLHSWVSSSLRLSPPMPRTWPPSCRLPPHPKMIGMAPRR